MNKSTAAALGRASAFEHSRGVAERRRDLAVVSAREKGASLEQCAEAIDYSIEGVRKLIARHEEVTA
jgi:hypothetical protein